MLAEIRLVGARAISAVSPYVSCGVVRIDQALTQPSAISSGCVGDLLSADDLMPAVNRDVAFIAEGGNGDVDRR